MKNRIRNGTAGSLVVAALLLLGIACGGKETVASKSAEAFRDAQKKGVAPGGAHDDHSPAAGEQATMTGMDHSTMTGMDHSTMTGMDHSTMTGMDHSKVQHGQSMAGMDHSKMQHGRSMAGMDHSKMQHGQSMAGMDHSKMQHGRSMAGMDHSKMQHGQSMAGMDHSKMQHGRSMAGMDHSKMQHGQSMTGMDHSKMQHGQSMAGMDHSKMQHGQTMPGMDHSNMPGMHHGTTARANVNPPTTNDGVPRVRPGGILEGDAFDAPAAAAVAEAMKASRGGGHEGMEMRGITPGTDRENPPTPAPAFRDGTAQGGNAAPAIDHSSHGQAAAATAYACPMHPEVTSDKPGTCPKCGMALVKKK